MTFDEAKGQLELLLRDKLKDTNANFRVATDLEWWGDCPRPSPKIKAENRHTHLIEDSRVCLDCEQIHVVREDFEKMTPEIIVNLANFINYNYRRMIHS